MVEWRERIVCDPGILAGKPSIKGTRLAVELILGWLAHDWSPQRLLDAYPQLTPEDIAAALAYAAESLHREPPWPSGLGPTDGDGPRLSQELRDAARRSVLCWLATADALGQPSVSPKEIFAVFDAEHFVVANIASPGSARNIGVNPRVCIGFVDVFVQKGFKVIGIARHVRRHEAEFAHWAAPLLAMAGPRFPLHGVFVVLAVAVEPIVAPSYRLHPGDTDEASQVAAAMRRYGVQPAPSGP